MEKVLEILNQLKSTTKTNEKLAILKQHSDNELLKKVLENTYNPNKNYGVSEKNLQKLLSSDIKRYEPEWSDGFEMLLALSRTSINDYLRGMIIQFLEYQDEELRELWIRILTKDLKIGMNVKSINKVFKDLIPLSESGFPVRCMLASKFSPKSIQNKTMYVTEKLDGIRCWAKYENNEVTLYTRQGKSIIGCMDIESSIKDLAAANNLNNFILDGEILATNCSYKDVYKETTKRLKNKKEIKDGLYYNVFDIISLTEAIKGVGNKKYSERRESLDSLKDNEYVKVSPLLYKGNDMADITNILDTYRDKGAEGLMINLDDPYEFKRSASILKLKIMQSCDLRVVGFEEGQGNFIGILGAVLLEYKDNIVKCGSGWSLEEREEIWSNQSKYINKILEINYFEETYDSKTKLPSLRFPVKKTWRNDKTEPSYN